MSPPLLGGSVSVYAPPLATTCWTGPKGSTRSAVGAMAGTRIAPSVGAVFHSTVVLPSAPRGTVTRRSGPSRVSRAPS